MIARSAGCLLKSQGGDLCLELRGVREQTSPQFWISDPDGQAAGKRRLLAFWHSFQWRLSPPYASVHPFKLTRTTETSSIRTLSRRQRRPD